MVTKGFLDLEARSELLLHLSRISRLEGQVEALLEAAIKTAKQIEELQTKQIALDGLRSSLS